MVKKEGWFQKRLLWKADATGFVLSAIVALFPFAAASQQLSEEVMRLHVIAASDSPEDQAVKLKVRDAVLAEAAKWYKGANSLEEANSAVCLHLQAIEKAAERVLTENHVTDQVKVQVLDRYFSTREYEEFRLPAGKYRTLQVILGEGKGKNWWCVVFPALCLPASQQKETDLLAQLPSGGREEFRSPQGYQVKFKVVELYETLLELFDS